MTQKIQRLISVFVGWSILILLVLAATLVTAVRELAPSISNYKADIETYFSDLSNADVRFEAVQLTWPGLAPEVELSGGTIRPNGGDEIQARFDRFYLQVDLLASLWNGALTIRFAQLEGFDLKLTQLADGRWFNSTGRQSTVEYRRIADALLRTNDIQIIESSIDLHTMDQRVIPLKIYAADVTTQNDNTSIDAEVSFGAFSNPARLTSRFVGAPWKPTFKGRTYIDARNQVLDAGVQSLVFANSEYSLDFNLDRDLNLGAQFWFEWDSINSVDGQAVFESNFLPLSKDATDILIENISVGMDMHWQDQSISFIEFVNTSADINGARAQLPDVLLSTSHTVEGIKLRLEFERLSLDDVNSHLELLPDSKLKDTLTTLDLKGELLDVIVDMPLYAPMDTLINARINGLQVEAIKGSPKLVNLSGTLVSGLLDGYIDIRSTNMLMGFPKLYHEAFAFDQATGRVYWSVDPDRNTLLVGGKALNFAGELGDLSGAFFVDGLLSPSESDAPQLYLQLGLDRADIVDQSLLVPYTVSQNLRDWLDRALVYGDVNEADFVLRSDLIKGCRDCVGMQLTVDARDAGLSYMEAWPTVENVDVNLYIDNKRLDATARGVNYLGLAADQAQVILDRRKDNPSVIVQAALTGMVEDVTAALPETPLWSNIEAAFGRWDFTGELIGDLNIDIPMANPAAIDLNLALNLSDGSLVDYPLQLSVNDINGELRVTQSSVVAKGMEALVWGKPASFDVQVERGLTELDFETRLSMTDLSEWSSIDFTTFVQGESEISGTLQFDSLNNLNKLDLSSSLLGVSVDLPDRWSKPAAQATTLAVSMPMYQNGYDINLSYGADAQADLSVRDGVITSGVVALGDDVEVQPERPFWIALDVDRIELPPLREWLVSKAQVMAPGTVEERAYDRALFGGQAKLKLLRINDDIVVSSVDAKAVEQLTDWDIEIDSGELAGTVRWPKREEPIELRLSELSLPKASEESSLSDIHPRVLEGYPAANIHMANLIYDDKSFGSWHFEFRPLSDGIVIQNLHGVYGYLSIGSEEHPTSLTWTGEGETSHTTLEFNAATEDFNALREQLGLAIPLAAQKLDVSGSGSWAGAPYQFDLLTMNSEFGFRAENGRFETEQDGGGATRLFNLINFNTWARRLKLDFSDLEEGGISYDRLSGDIALHEGVIDIERPILLESPLSKFVMRGSANLVDNTLDAELDVTLPVSNNVAWIAALAVGLPTAAGVFLAGQVFEEQFDRLSTLSYSISGSSEDPDIEFEGFFGEGDSN